MKLERPKFYLPLYFCAMAVKDLRDFVQKLEDAGELVRIKEYVNPYLEIAEITDRVSKTEGQNKALLFENTGKDFPLLINMMGSEKRMAMALGVDKIDDARKEIEALMADLMAPKQGIMNQLQMLPKLGKLASWMPKLVNTKMQLANKLFNQNQILRNCLYLPAGLLMEALF